MNQALHARSARWHLRRYVPADEPAVAELLTLAAADLRALPWLVYDNEDFVSKPVDFVSRRLSRGLLELAGTFVACRDSAVVGTASCWCSPEDGLSLLQWLTVHPAFRRRGIGSALLRRCEEHAQERACRELQMERWVDSRTPGLCRLLASRNYRRQRPQQMNITMQAALRPERLADPELPRGFRITTYEDEAADWVRLKNAVFSSNTTIDWFRQNYVEKPSFYPEGWFFAEHRGKKVGVASALLHPGSEDDTLSGSIEWVGNLPEVRGKGVGRALTLACMRFLYQCGLDQAILMTQYFRKPAVALYRSLGFRVAREHRLYAKRLQA